MMRHDFWLICINEQTVVPSKLSTKRARSYKEWVVNRFTVHQEYEVRFGFPRDGIKSCDLGNFRFFTRGFEHFPTLVYTAAKVIPH